MTVKRLPSIRSRLAWLVAACMLPVMVAAGVLLFYEYHQQRNGLVQTARTSARALMVAVDKEFASASLAMAVLATSPSLDNGDLNGFQAQAEQVLGSSFISSIVLVDAAGRQLVNTAGLSGQQLSAASTLAQVGRVINSGITEVSGLTLDDAGKIPLITVAVPVLGRAQALLAVIKADHLQQVIASHGLPPDRITVVFDRQALIGGRSHEAARFVGKSVSSLLLNALKTKEDGVVEAITLEGIPVVSVYTHSTATGWGTAIGTPAHILTSDLKRSMGLLGGFFAALLAISLGAAWLIGGRVARAVGALREPALQLSQGGLVQVPPLAIREAHEVGQAISSVSAALSQANTALTENETRMRGILQSARDAIIILDDVQVIVLFNAAAAAMFGCAIDKAVGRPVTEFIPQRFHAQHFGFVARYQAHANASRTEPYVAVGLRLNQEEFPLELSYSRADESGATFHTLIIRDITTRVSIFKSLERRNHDLQQFAFVASHDLKTPLRSISGFVQLLEKKYADKLDASGLSLIHRTAKAAGRLEQLTDDLLAYAQISAETRALAEVNCSEVAGEVADLLDASLKQAGAVLALGELPRVMGDRTQLVQLLMNLVGNAVKYCQGRAPVVKVSATRKDGQWLFAVADNGIGVDSAHFDKIFEVFKRLHTQAEYPGTGIGLAVCRRVVERHGGAIWLESALGEGSTFYFTLPAIPIESVAS